MICLGDDVITVERAPTRRRTGVKRRNDDQLLNSMYHRILDELLVT